MRSLSRQVQQAPLSLRRSAEGKSRSIAVVILIGGTFFPNVFDFPWFAAVFSFGIGIGDKERMGEVGEDLQLGGLLWGSWGALIVAIKIIPRLTTRLSAL